MLRIETRSSAETEAAGADLAARLEPGDVVAVTGELGSGKTTLIRGACRALGVTDTVTSPTFTIGQLYRARRGDAIFGVAHIDLYRLAELGKEDPALLDDYLTGDRIAFVEWPEVAGSLIARPRARVHIEHLAGDRRRLEIS